MEMPELKQLHPKVMAVSDISTELNREKNNIYVCVTYTHNYVIAYVIFMNNLINY